MHHPRDGHGLLVPDEDSRALLDEKAMLSDADSDGDWFALEPREMLSKWGGVVGSSLHQARTLRWRSCLVRAAIFLVPSFLQHHFTRETRRPDKIGPTAYLDGMRGLAALTVFFCHYFYQSFVIAEGWGSAPHNYHILKLPFLRLWYQGPPAVCVFFVISGYALSLRPLKFVRSRSYEDFAVTLSSLTFRRGIRLYLPTTISTFMVVILLRLGVYEMTRDFANDRTYMKNIVEPHPVHFEHTWDQLKDWAWAVYNFVCVFYWGNYDGSTGQSLASEFGWNQD